VSDPNSVPNEAVRAQIDRILLWQGFADSPQLGRFLRHVVEQKLSGNAAAVKEILIGQEVFNRSSSFDPKSDSIVRSEARRLRTKLAEYYGGEGAHDRLRIDVPKGGYLPVFSVRNGAAAVAPPATAATGRARRPVLGWPIAAALVGLALIGLAAGYYLRVRKPSLPAVHVRRSVAVLGFDNLAGRAGDAWLSGAISGMLGTELAADGTLRTIPGEDVAHMEKDLGLGRREAFSRGGLDRIRRYIGADLLVNGGYTVLAAPGNVREVRIRLDLRVQNAQTGETRAFAQTGTEEGLFDLVSGAGAQLRQALGVQPLSAAETGALQKAEPSTPEAKRLYYDGLARMRDYEWAHARDLLTKAEQSEPTFPLTHVALSEVWEKLVYTKRSREEAKTAFDLSPNLAPEDRLLAEARYRGASGDWARAEQIYRDLWTRFPDNVEYGLRLADAQAKQQKDQAALATVGILHRLPHPLGDDPSIDLAESGALVHLPRYREALAAAQRAERKARARGARGVLWQALGEEAEDLNSMGQSEQERKANLELRQICSGLGDQICVARALARIGIMDTHTDLKEAERQFQASYDIAQREGSFYAANALSNLGAVLQMEGDYARAEWALSQAAKATEEANDKSFLIRVTINRGALLFSEGKLHPAEEMFRKSISITGEGDVKTWLGEALEDLSQVRELQGDLTEAMKLRQQGLALMRTSQRSGADWLAWIARLLWMQGDLRAARQTLDEAEKEAKKAGDNGFAAQHAEFVWLAIDEGHATAGEALARQAEDQSKTENRSTQAADACELLARCLLAEGKLAEAQAAIGRARSYLGAQKAGSSFFDISVTAARVQAATGDYKDRSNINAAIRNLDTSIAEARGEGFVGVQLDARLARGEIRVKSGHVADGRAELTALAKDATARGYGLIARKASQLGQAGTLVLH
jgi:tetratricopeptide (TPR) repeat protein